MEEHDCVDNDKLIEDVKQFGWAVMLIEGTDYLPSFAYTVGLWKNYKHAELIAFGLTTKTLHAILNIGGDIIKGGKSLQVGKIYDDFFEGGECQFVLVDRKNLDDYFSNAIWYNQTRDFPAMQLVWTDRNGKFLWVTGLIRFFASMEDPRVERTKLHKFIDIIAITIAAVICGCEDSNEIELFGKLKKEWLSTFLELPHGIPSHDTFNRFFAALNPQVLQQCFLNWIQEVAHITEGRIVSIDGKRLCGSGTEGKKAIVHMVTAWCNANNMVLGQVKTEDKSNEITAIPELLNLLDIKGCTVTIDAMGCQRDIAAKIIEKEGDYLLAVKGNQGHLLDDIKEAFEKTPALQQQLSSTLETGHGRIEKRNCHVIDDIDWVCNHKGWKGLKKLIKITAERTDKSSGEQSKECRYYISSATRQSDELLNASRQHWGIENKLHWMLDVNFHEDASRKKAGNAAQNFSVISRIALNLLQNEKSKKLSIKKKRLAAGWKHSYLEKLLFDKV